MITTYSVVIDGETAYTSDNLSDAIRAWDGLTYLEKAPVGGITVRTLRRADGAVVRDGNILNVDTDGRVYLNPNLTAT